MKIRTECVYPPIPIRDFDWIAVDDDTYDGAEDSGNRNMIGYGKTEQDAIADLEWKLAEARIEAEDEAEERAAHGQFGVGA